MIMLKVLYIDHLLFSRLDLLIMLKVLIDENPNFPVTHTGKDRIIFVTKEEHETPSSAELIEEDPNDPYEERGECGDKVYSVDQLK